MTDNNELCGCTESIGEFSVLYAYANNIEDCGNTSIVCVDIYDNQLYVLLNYGSVYPKSRVRVFDLIGNLVNDSLIESSITFTGMSCSGSITLSSAELNSNNKYISKIYDYNVNGIFLTVNEIDLLENIIISSLNDNLAIVRNFNLYGKGSIYSSSSMTKLFDVNLYPYGVAYFNNCYYVSGVISGDPDTYIIQKYDGGTYKYLSDVSKSDFSDLRGLVVVDDKLLICNSARIDVLNELEDIVCYLSHDNSFFTFARYDGYGVLYFCDNSNCSIKMFTCPNFSPTSNNYNNLSSSYSFTLTEFGSSSVGSLNITAIQEVTINTVAIIRGSSDFSFFDTLPISVSTGGTIGLQITFIPSKIGVRNGVALVNFNEFPLRGIALDPNDTSTLGNPNMPAEDSDTLNILTAVSSSFENMERNIPEDWI